MLEGIKQGLVIKSEKNKNVVISGYASVYNIADQQNDVVVRGAFSSIETKAKYIKLLWQHKQHKPIGVISSLAEDDYGLKMEAVINSKISAGREAVELIKQGALNGLSIGFHIGVSSYNELGQRVITKADLVEVSVVTFPANQSAQIYHVYENSESLDFNSLKSELERLDNLISQI